GGDRRSGTHAGCGEQRLWPHAVHLGQGPGSRAIPSAENFQGRASQAGQRQAELNYNPRAMKRGSLLAGVLALFVLATACAPNFALAKALTLTDVLGGYYDEGVKDGKTRLPPSLTFRLHNASDKTIGPVQ